MNEIEIILGGCGVLIVVFIIIAHWRKKREERRMKIDATVERVIRANEPGYEPPGRRRRMRMTIKDGVVTYRKDRSQEKKKEDGR